MRRKRTTRAEWKKATGLSSSLRPISTRFDPRRVFTLTHLISPPSLSRRLQYVLLTHSRTLSQRSLDPVLPSNPPSRLSPPLHPHPSRLPLLCGRSPSLQIQLPLTSPFQPILTKTRPTTPSAATPAGLLSPLHHHLLLLRRLARVFRLPSVGGSARRPLAVASRDGGHHSAVVHLLQRGFGLGWLGRGRSGRGALDAPWTHLMYCQLSSL